jgi:hypothetical protein
LAKAVWSSSLAIRSGVASKFIRKGRSTVTLRKPNSRFSKMRETTRVSVSPFLINDDLGRLAVAVVAVDAGQMADLVLGDLVALVVEALLHLLKEAVPSISCTLPRRSGPCGW